MSKEGSLFPVTISHSQRLWQIQVSFAGLLCVASLLAVYRLVFIHPHWILIECVFLFAVLLWLIHCKKLSKQALIDLKIIDGKVLVKKHTGELVGQMGEGVYAFAQWKGTILVWPWVIVLPLEFVEDKNKKLQLIVLRDSCSHEEWRRLRVYLLSQ